MKPVPNLSAHRHKLWASSGLHQVLLIIILLRMLGMQVHTYDGEEFVASLEVLCCQHAALSRIAGSGRLS